MKLRNPLTLPSGATWSSGAGSPEGAVAAPVGSLYSRSDGGADSAIYRKETGTGATGWVAVADVYVTTTPPLATPSTGDLWWDLDDPSTSAAPGIATGGTTGQVLTKNSAIDFDTNWTTPPDTSTKVTGVGITTIQAITSAAYDALAVKDPTTLYVIT